MLMEKIRNSNIKLPEPFRVVRDVGRENRNVMGNYLLVQHVRGLGWNVLGLMLLARPTSLESEFLSRVGEKSD
jgi:hypothetical protein